MKPPLHQKISKIVMWILGGFIALSSVLDGVANAISLLTPFIAGIGTACIVLVWVLAYIILPSHPLSWVVDTQRVWVTKLGVQPTAFAIGIVLLLWMPSVIAQWQPLSRPADTAADRPVELHVTFEDVFDKLKAHDASFERDPRVARTFWLLHEPDASITLGKCPSPECFQFTLGDLNVKGGNLVQQIFLSGAGFGVRRNPKPGLALHIDSAIILKGSSLGLDPNSEKMWAELVLARGNSFGMSTVLADILLKVLDTRSDSLRIYLEVRHGTYESPQQRRGKQPAAK